MTVEEAIDLLSKKKRSLSGGDVEQILSDIGFVFSPGKAPNHRVAKHSGLSERTSFQFISLDTTHKKKGPILVSYVVNILRTLKVHQDVLMELNGERND